MKIPSAILTADIELRAYQPTCRTDNHWEAQDRKIRWLCKLQERYDCPIFDAGDLFDKKYKSNPNHALLAWALSNMPVDFYTVPGNHDLPGKSVSNFNNSAMAVLQGAGIIHVLVPPVEFAILPNAFVIGFPWDAPIKFTDGHLKRIEKARKHDQRIVALIHAMVYKKDLPFSGCEGYSGKDVLKLLPEADLVVTGHHHATFTEKIGNRILVNPGSLMRNDADQADFQPSVFLWYAEDNSIEQIHVPIEEGVVSREHIDVVKNRETRMDAFIEKLGDQVAHGVNFHDNLEKVVDTTDVTQQVKDKVWEYYEKGI